MKASTSPKKNSMQNPLVPIARFSVFPLLLLSLSACAQQEKPEALTTETAFFSDVTATHLPADPKAHALDVALADVDKDGDLDAILALENEPNRLYLNDGKGKFTWKKNAFLDEKHDTEHIRVADFNKDGNADVIFVAEDDQFHEYYFGDGKGSFQNVTDRLPAKSEGNGLDVGDINGDGLPDVIIGNTGKEAQNFLWLNNSEKPGFFIDATAQNLPKLNSQTQSVKLFDLDKDGDLDLIIGNEVPPNRVFFNNGKGKFTEHPEKLQLNVPLHTREVIVFDANEDGHPDILFANLTSNGGQKEKDPRARLLINDGTANFKDETEQRIPAQDYSTYAANIIDFNKDGHPDLILSALKIPPFEAMQLQALQNDGKGNFKNVTSAVIPPSTVERSWGIAVGDVNGDGKPDLFIGGWGSQARLLLGK